MANLGMLVYSWLPCADSSVCLETLEYAPLEEPGEQTDGN